MNKKQPGISIRLMIHDANNAEIFAGEGGLCFSMRLDRAGVGAFKNALDKLAEDMDKTLFKTNGAPPAAHA